MLNNYIVISFLIQNFNSILTSNLRNESSLFIIENFSNKKKSNYKEVKLYSDKCDCRNGGTCEPNNDLCACIPKYSGRNCEIDTSNGNYGCGILLQDEIELFECANCSCSQQLLTCKVISNSICNNILSNLNDKHEVKSDLSLLISTANFIENDIYNFYIAEYKNRYGYKIVYKDIENREDMDMLDYESNDKDQLIAFKLQNRFISLYFPRVTNSNKSQSYHRLPVLLSTFINFIFLKAYFKSI